MDKTRVLLADDQAVACAGIGKALGKLDDLEIIEEVGIARAMSISISPNAATAIQENARSILKRLTGVKNVLVRRLMW